MYNMQLGMAYLKEGDMPRAKGKLITAVTQAPKLPDVNVAMAYFLEKTGEIQQAESWYLKAIALAPGNGAFLNNYGTFLCRTKRYKEAENYYIKAIHDPNYLYTAGAYENAGLCMEMNADYDKAEVYFLKALKQDPNRKQSLREITKIALRQNKLEKALDYLNQYPALVSADDELERLKTRAMHSKKPNNITDPGRTDNDNDRFNG